MCVIVYTTINNKQILVKNRDRIYKPNIVIIHELINNIEIAYIKDLNTGWIEGINSNGVGIINSTLNRNDGKQKLHKSYLKKKKIRIYEALKHTNSKQIIHELVANNNKNVPFLEGHTLVCNEGCTHIENTVNNKYSITKVNETVVFTNSGIRFDDAGYTTGLKGLSSLLRRKNIEMELKNTKISSNEELINIMNKNYINIDPRFHSYRDKANVKKFLHKNTKKNFKCISTTGQLLLNLTDKELVYYADVNNSKKVKYLNKLPTNYNPVIRIIINETEKNLEPKKSKLTRKYLKKMYKKYNYNNKTKKNILIK